MQNGKESFYPHKILQFGFLDTFLEMSENPSISSIGIQSGILFQIKIQEYFLSFWSWLYMKPQMRFQPELLKESFSPEMLMKRLLHTIPSLLLMKILLLDTIPYSPVARLFAKQTLVWGYPLMQHWLIQKKIKNNQQTEICFTTRTRWLVIFCSAANKWNPTFLHGIAMHCLRAKASITELSFYQEGVWSWILLLWTENGIVELWEMVAIISCHLSCCNQSHWERKSDKLY